jgi:hypothetical protein
VGAIVIGHGDTVTDVVVGVAVGGDVCRSYGGGEIS